MSSTGHARDAGSGIRTADDEQRWRAIVERFAPYVHAVGCAHGLPEPAIRDVFDDVFTRLWTELRSSHSVDDVALRSRVIDVTERVAADRRRSSRMGHPPSDGALARLRDALEVHDAVRSLPASHRELLRRRIVEEQDEADIAEALGISVDVVADGLRGARARLRRRATAGQQHLRRPRRHDPA